MNSMTSFLLPNSITFKNSTNIDQIRQSTIDLQQELPQLDEIIPILQYSCEIFFSSDVSILLKKELKNYIKIIFEKYNLQLLDIFLNILNLFLNNISHINFSIEIINIFLVNDSNLLNNIEINDFLEQINLFLLNKLEDINNLSISERKKIQFSIISLLELKELYISKYITYFQFLFSIKNPKNQNLFLKSISQITNISIFLNPPEEIKFDQSLFDFLSIPILIQLINECSEEYFLLYYQKFIDISKKIKNSDITINILNRIQNLKNKNNFKFDNEFISLIPIEKFDLTLIKFFGENNIIIPISILNKINIEIDIFTLFKIHPEPKTIKSNLLNDILNNLTENNINIVPFSFLDQNPILLDINFWLNNAEILSKSNHLDLVTNCFLNHNTDLSNALITIIQHKNSSILMEIFSNSKSFKTLVSSDIGCILTLLSEYKYPNLWKLFDFKDILINSFENFQSPFHMLGYSYLYFQFSEEFFSNSFFQNPLTDEENEQISKILKNHNNKLFNFLNYDSLSSSICTIISAAISLVNSFTNNFKIPDIQLIDSSNVLALFSITFEFSKIANNNLNIENLLFLDTFSSYSSHPVLLLQDLKPPLKNYQIIFSTILLDCLCLVKHRFFISDDLMNFLITSIFGIWDLNIFQVDENLLKSLIKLTTYFLVPRNSHHQELPQVKKGLTHEIVQNFFKNQSDLYLNSLYQCFPISNLNPINYKIKNFNENSIYNILNLSIKNRNIDFIQFIFNNFSFNYINIKIEDRKSVV